MDLNDDKLQQCYDNFIEFTDHMVGVHGAMPVAAVMMTQAMSIYRSSLTGDEYQKIIDTISASRNQVKTFNQVNLQ